MAIFGHNRDFLGQILQDPSPKTARWAGALVGAHGGLKCEISAWSRNRSVSFNIARTLAADVKFEVFRRFQADSMVVISLMSRLTP